MRKVLFSLAALAIVLGAIGTAHADWFTVTNPKPNSIKAGIFWPSDGDLRDETDDIWFQAAYERVIAEMPESNSDITVEAAWTENGSGNVDVRAIPVTINWRQHGVPSSENGGAFYWGAGIGLAWMKADFDEPDGDTVGDVELAQFDGDGSESTTRMTYSAFIGQNYESWLWEVKYRYTPLSGENAGGIFGSVGLRF